MHFIYSLASSCFIVSSSYINISLFSFTETKKLNLFHQAIPKLLSSATIYNKQLG